jgi:hypothetical protein
VPPQKRRAFPPHAWRRLAEVGAVEVVRGAVFRRRRAQRRGGEPPSERRYMCCARGGWPKQGGDRQLGRPVDKLHIRPQARRTALRRMAFFSAFFLSFLSSKR